MGPVNPVLRPLVLFVRCWPQLVACYLVGMVGRHYAIELAAWAGHDSDWWTALTMPLVAIARLGSYVAMFLVLRRAIPALAELPRKSVRRLDLFATIIVPFFAIYLAWQMFREDWLAFEARAQDYRVEEAVMSALASGTTSDLHPEALPPSSVTLILVAGAFATRVLLTRLKDRLPKWLVIVRVYVDAVWVFLVLTLSVRAGFTLLVNPGKWVSERRIIVWFNTTRAELFSSFRPLEVAWDALMSAVHTVFGGATIPLLWLAVAGIVYGATNTASWRSAVRRTAGQRATVLLDRAAPASQRIRHRWRKVPQTLRDKTLDYLRSQIGRFQPIADSARIIMHAGVFVLALYVLAYLGLAWLDMSGSFYRLQSGPGYLFRGMAWLLGPHSIEFWKGYGDALSLLSHMIIEPLRICLVASTFAYCVEHVAKSERQPQQNAPVGGGEVDGGRHGAVGQQEAELHRTGSPTLVADSLGGQEVESPDGLVVPSPRPVGDDRFGATSHQRTAGSVDGDDV
ncbi:MAG TPA: hypothetical protein VH496_09845 [Mycobacterium sp.]|jgi:hypothetical protein